MGTDTLQALHSSYMPEIDAQVYSGFEVVSQLDPSLINELGQYRSDETWGVCDAFRTDSDGSIRENSEVMEYELGRGWEGLPEDESFRTAYDQIRNTILTDASQTYGTSNLEAMIQITHSGSDLDQVSRTDFDNVPHLDFVGLNGQRVLVYYASNASPTRIFVGGFPFKGFADDYSQEPGFDNLVETTPEPNELVRAEAITCIHAPDEPVAHRIFIRAFVEAVE